MNLVIVWTMRFSIDYRSSFIINTDIEFAPHILGNTIFHIIIIQYIHQFIHVIIETLIQIPAIFEGAELLPLPPEVPGMSKVPDPIHPALRQLLVDQRPDWMSDNWRAITNSVAASSRKAYRSPALQKAESGLPASKRGQPYPLCG